MKENIERVPLWEKFLLTVNEASEVFNIGEKKLRAIISNNRKADFIRYNGERLMIVRCKFEEFLLENPTF